MPGDTIPERRASVFGSSAEFGENVFVEAPWKGAHKMKAAQGKESSEAGTAKFRAKKKAAEFGRAVVIDFRRQDLDLVVNFERRIRKALVANLVCIKRLKSADF